MTVARLSLSLLGTFQITLDEVPVKDFKSNKVRALLAYLAVEADRPHLRDSLAGLLWPDWPDREALSNLRYALSDLRRAIGDRTAAPPFLLISRNSIQFNTASDYWLDTTKFIENVTSDKSQPDFADQLEEALSIYRGVFLEGFSVEDSHSFDEWALLTREQLARQAASALHALADNYEQRGDYERAQSYAWKQLGLEPWDETAHQTLMRNLALSGQRGAALAQYETCKELLAEELNVEPAEETTKLYEQIRDGILKAHAPSPAVTIDITMRFSPLLQEEPAPVESPIFVARENELNLLDGFLNQVLAGQGRVVFVTGEAGSGKTSLVQEFAQRAQKASAELVVASRILQRLYWRWGSLLAIS